MNNKILLPLAFVSLLTAFVTSLTPVNAGSGSFANGLNGNTWLTTSGSNPKFYYGNAQSSRLTAPYYLAATAATATNCDGWHAIAQATEDGNWVTSVTMPGVIAGSTECDPDDIPSEGLKASVTGTHQMRLTVGSSITQGVTNEVSLILP